jgi:hypothetical protein
MSDERTRVTPAQAAWLRVIGEQELAEQENEKNGIWPDLPPPLTREQFDEQLERINHYANNVRAIAEELNLRSHDGARRKSIAELEADIAAEVCNRQQRADDAQELWAELKLAQQAKEVAI